MKAWKRNVLIVYLVCSILVLVFYLLFLFGGLGGSALPGFVKALLVLPAVALVAGVGVGAYYVVYAFVHEHATLHAGPEGTINIERSALESTAKRAMSSVEGVRLQHVAARVLARQGEPVIDLTVTAVPFGSESLMTVANRIQTTVKQAVEGFTDHEVRYVAVNFVEPRKRQEVKAARESVDTRAANGYVPPRYTSENAPAEKPATLFAEKLATPFAEKAAPSFATADFTVEEAKPSLWDRARTFVDGLRTKKDEDVVETAAVVESVESAANGADTCAGAEKADAPQDGEPKAAAPFVDLDDDFDPWGAKDEKKPTEATTVLDEPVEGAAVKDAK